MAHTIPATPGAGKLFDQLRTQFNFKSDAALARWLDVDPPVISLMRHGKRAMGPLMMINLCDALNWPVKTLKAALAGAAA